jgi:molybdopterin/thiamine biosynthesis adenylyltransferase
MQAVHLIRQSEIIPIEKLGEEITLIGAGAIGSFTALALTKMGFGNMTVMDMDVLEHENMNCQFYPLDAVGAPKAHVLGAMLKAFSGFDVTAKIARYEGGGFTGIVIAAVDNMATRRLLWEEQRRAGTCRLFIDPRMGAESGLIYVMKPNDEKDVKSYEKTLYKDEEAVQERCTAKSTVYSAVVISGMVAKAVKDFVLEAPYSRVATLGIRDNVYQLWNVGEAGLKPEAFETPEG